MKREGFLVVLIAVALGTFAAPANAVTVSCGDTITQDTTLDSDLLNCPGDGVVVGAPNITLDLNGHTIDGDETGGPACDTFVEGSGVSNPDGHDGITIENGTIQEFAIGIVGGFGRSHMRDLTIRSNRFYGIIIGAFPPDSVDANEIERNVVTGNGCGGIGVFGGSNGRIELNQVTDTQAGEGGIVFPAISMDGVSNTLIARNTVSGNPGEAIGGGGDNGNTITGNTVSDNGDGIVLFDGSANNVVEKNIATGNGGGVVIVSSTQNEVSGNSLNDNLFVGVVVVGGEDNRIEENSIAFNGFESAPGMLEGGIHVTSTDEGDGSDRTVVLKNTLERNRGDGILVDAGQTGTVIDGNRSDRNIDDGIDVDEPATTLRKNIANSNRDLGIEAVAGVTDGGGNRARGNRNPRQCVNVRCK
jgi:large repetitive protein